MAETLLLVAGIPKTYTIKDSAPATSLMRVSVQGVVTTADKSYTHDQMTPSTTWTVNHNLNKFPAIMVVDSAGNVVEGCIQEIDTIHAILTFTSAFSGHAYCN